MFCFLLHDVQQEQVNWLELHLSMMCSALKASYSRSEFLLLIDSDKGSKFINQSMNIV